jgi:hypothetical protein
MTMESRNLRRRQAGSAALAVRDTGLGLRVTLFFALGALSAALLAVPYASLG